jgi:A/G-specific adenine glycosylase
VPRGLGARRRAYDGAVHAPPTAAVRRRLLAWFGRAKRDLPWRFPIGEEDPYRTWISEAMLQQTQVATVIPYYRRFLARFPSLRALARASEEEVLGAWSGLGYYARARALSRAAREALARHGELPRTLEDLRALPGFGPYTAGAVASIAFGVRTPAVDGNAGRVLARLFLVEGAPHSGPFRERVWSLAEALVRPARRPGDFNQALIELGALVCRARTPQCERCPLESLCAARQAGRERSVPAATRRAVKQRLTLSVGICSWRGRILLVRRGAGGLFARMWAPPSVQVGTGEDPRAAISSAIRREPSVETGEFRFLGAVERTLTHRSVELLVHAAALRRPPNPGADVRLVAPEELAALPVPSAFRVALALAEDGRGSEGGRRVGVLRRRAGGARR